MPTMERVYKKGRGAMRAQRANQEEAFPLRGRSHSSVVCVRYRAAKIGRSLYVGKGGRGNGGGIRPLPAKRQKDACWLFPHNLATVGGRKFYKNFRNFAGF